MSVCGTLRKNRGEPQIIREVTKTDLGVEGKIVRHNDRVLVVAWQDKRLVKMITTCHHDRMERVEVWQKVRETYQVHTLIVSRERTHGWPRSACFA